MPTEKLRARFMGEMAMGMLLSMFSGLIASIMLAGLVLILPSPANAGEGSKMALGPLLTKDQVRHGNFQVQTTRPALSGLIKAHGNLIQINRSDAGQIKYTVFAARVIRPGIKQEDV